MRGVILDQKPTGLNRQGFPCGVKLIQAFQPGRRLARYGQALF